MTEADMQMMIHRVADLFEREQYLRVDETARWALLSPAIPHMEEVNRGLATYTISVPFLEQSVQQVLENARPFVRGNIVDENAIKQSMTRQCPYLFWC
jgi:hypothetical protein